MNCNSTVQLMGHKMSNFIFNYNSRVSGSILAEHCGYMLSVCDVNVYCIVTTELKLR